MFEFKCIGSIAKSKLSFLVFCEDLVAMAKELGIRNLNEVGKCLDTLLNGESLDEELDHLINVLKGSSVK